jgi:hypothetical protein
MSRRHRIGLLITQQGIARIPGEWLPTLNGPDAAALG